MRKVKSKIRGCKSVVVSGSSYDIAYQLCHTLRLYSKKFQRYRNLVSDGDLVIYPSAWYEKFFEVTLRDKNHVKGNQYVDSDELMEVVSKFLPVGWHCFKEDYIVEGDVVCTPVVLKFRFDGVN